MFLLSKIVLSDRQYRYPWGDEAINKARQENKPIFLSVGYSTCQYVSLDFSNVFDVSLKVPMLPQPPCILQKLTLIGFFGLRILAGAM